MSADKDYIASLTVGALASIGETGAPQIATIFMAHDVDGTIVFKSRRGSDHMKSLPPGARAAISAYSHNSNYKVKSGVQIRGRIEEIKEVAEMSAAIELYSNTFDGARAKFLSPEEHVEPSASSTLFRFVPESFKLLAPELDRSDLHYTSWK